MSKWIYNSNGVTPGKTIASGGATFYGLSGFDNLTEASAQLRVRGAYTASNLWCNVTALTGTLTMTDRKNTAAGSQTISITTTGTKEDTTHTTSLADGDLYCTKATLSGGHSDTCTLFCVSVLLDDAAAGVSMLMGMAGNNALTTSANFLPFAGQPFPLTTESFGQTIFRFAATLRNFRTYLSANTFTGTITLRTRINGANGGQSVSYLTTVTGEKEDTSGSDSVVAGDKCCGSKDSGGTANNATLAVISVKCVATASLPLSGSNNSINGTDYVPIGCDFPSQTTESRAQIKSRVADTFKNMQCNVATNASATGTVDFRAGAASPGGGPSISITSAQTGLLEDLTGSYTTATTDLINYRIVTSGGAIFFEALGCQQGVVVTSMMPFVPKSPQVLTRHRAYV